MSECEKCANKCGDCGYPEADRIHSMKETWIFRAHKFVPKVEDEPTTKKAGDMTKEADAASLPNCPLCGGSWVLRADGLIECREDVYLEAPCPLADGHCTPEQWRRLAAPPALPPEVVAVLRAAETSNAWSIDGRLLPAIEAWRKAGKPGLLPDAPEGKP